MIGRILRMCATIFLILIPSYSSTADEGEDRHLSKKSNPNIKTGLLKKSAMRDLHSSEENSEKLWPKDEQEKRSRSITVSLPAILQNKEKKVLDDEKLEDVSDYLQDIQKQATISASSNPEKHKTTSSTLIKNLSDKTKIKRNKTLKRETPATPDTTDDQVEKISYSPKSFRLHAGLIDDDVWTAIQKTMDKVSTIAQKENLTLSAFYDMTKNITKEILIKNPYVFSLATYILLSIMKEGDFRRLIALPLQPLGERNNDLLEGCKILVITRVRKLIGDAFLWSEVTRAQDEDAYFKKLLTLNDKIDTSSVYGPYSAGHITISFLHQLTYRNPDCKTDISSLMYDTDRVNKQIKTTEKIIAKQALFINHKVSWETPKLQNKKRSKSLDSSDDNS